MSPAEVSARYLTALRIADTFLGSWLKREAEEGVALMCERVSLRGQKLRRSSYGSWLRQFMIGLSNPHHQAFEIGRGVAITAEEFEFPVTLFELYTGNPQAFAYSSELRVALRDERWCVALLPVTSERLE